MTDVLFVLVLIAFFVACVGFVKVCERIIGPDPEGVPLTTGSDAGIAEPEAAAA
jgi:hypothetical protein